jgi:hypothetical protein
MLAALKRTVLRRDRAGIALAWLLLVAGALCGLLANRLPSPLPASAPAQKFSAQRALGFLQGLPGQSEPHPTGSVAARSVRDGLLGLLRTFGYEPQVQRTFACGRYGTCAPVENVVTRLEGAGPQSVLVACHYDSVAAGPGAGDDGAGVATVLEVARALRYRRFRNTVVFLFADGEELGLVGARAFVQEHPWASAVRAVINLDARGTGGPSLLFETGSAALWAARMFASSAPRPRTSSLFSWIYRRMPNDTDFSAFLAHGLQGFNFAFVGGAGLYHTPGDTLAHLDPATVQQQGQNALALTETIADLDFERMLPAQRAVFTDVAGRWLLWWPAGWSIVGLVGATVLLLLGGRRLGSQQRARVVRAFVRMLGANLAAAVLALGIVFAFAQIGFPLQGWVAHPGPWIVAFFLLGLLLAVSIPEPAGTDAPTSWLAVWSVWLTAAWATASLPEAGYLWLVPTAVAGAMGWKGKTTSPSNSQVRAALPAAAVGLLWLSLPALLYAGLGMIGLVGVAWCGAWYGLAVRPLLRSSGTRLRRNWLVPTAGCVILLLLAGAVLPRHTSATPAHATLALQADADGPVNRWLLFTDDRGVLRRFVEQAGFARQPVSVFPWSSARAYVAAAPQLRLAPPEVQLLQVATAGSERWVRLWVHSPPRAPLVGVFFDPASAVEELRVEGRPLQLEGKAARRWGTWHGCEILLGERSGVEVEVRVAGSPALTGIVYGVSPGFDMLAHAPVARPAWVVPEGAGDRTLVMHRFRIALQP